jgi:hypothetical protein
MVSAHGGPKRSIGEAFGLQACPTKLLLEATDLGVDLGGDKESFGCPNQRQVDDS